MLRRLIIASALLCASLLLYVVSAPARLPLIATAMSGLGERSYAVRLKHAPVGQLQASSTREAEGTYRFTSQLEFQLAQGQPVRVFETKRFSGLPPFSLLSAEQEDTTASAKSRITLKQAQGSEFADDKLSTTYRARITRGSNEQTRDLTWEHSLSDFLGVEQWLAEAPVEVPRSFSSLDFDTLRVRNDTWTLLARTAEGYEVTKSSRLEATRLFLDRNFKPLRFSMAGTFEIEAVNPGDLPISPEPVFHSQTYQVSLNEPIERHQTLRSLTLQVLGNHKLVERWDNSTTEDGKALLRGIAETVRMAKKNDDKHYRREELSYPLKARAVIELADIAADPFASPKEQAEQLTDFVYNYIHYDHHSTMQNVLDVIRSQRGDCNEYAELFTTLGRALGLSVRTVIGLAYTDEFSPAFALHAWNEVLFENGWQAFDPTWNQTEVDATHFPLPVDAGSMLSGLTALDEIEFRIHSLSY